MHSSWIAVDGEISWFENIEKLITSANGEIKKHNDIVNNYKSERSGLIQAIWKYVIETNKVDIEPYNKKITGLEKGISTLNGDVVEMRNSYKTLNIRDYPTMQ